MNILTRWFKTPSRDEKIVSLAFDLWREAGRPNGSMDRYLRAASELITIKENLAFFRLPRWNRMTAPPPLPLEAASVHKPEQIPARNAARQRIGLARAA